MCTKSAVPLCTAPLKKLCSRVFIVAVTAESAPLTRFSSILRTPVPQGLHEAGQALVISMVSIVGSLKLLRMEEVTESKHFGHIRT